MKNKIIMIMNKKFIYVAVIFILFLSFTLSGKNNSAKSMEFFKKGQEYYIKRDYKKAVDAWLKALKYNSNNDKLKKYFDSAAKKFYKAKEAFHNGVEMFKEKKYEDAKKFFKKSILINPNDTDAVYYYKLCFTPEFNIYTENNFFSTNRRDNFFFIDVSLTNVVNNWVESWKLIINDKDNNNVKIFSGRGIPKKKIFWDLRDNNGNRIQNKTNLKFFCLIKSIYGREVYSKTNRIVIDNILPECHIEAPSEFYPDSDNVKNNRVVFNVLVSDKGSGVKNWWIDIYNSSTNMVVKRVISDKKTVLWNGIFEDGSKIHGGEKIYYRLIALDKALNKCETKINPIEAKIFLKHEKRGLVMNLPNIEFQFNSARLRKSSYGILNKVGAVLERYKKAIFVIEGHTDNIGSEKKNLILSKKRAMSVYKYLKKRFHITDDRVMINGYGESKPLVPNISSENRKKNRRVEIVIKTKPEK